MEVNNRSELTVIILAAGEGKRMKSDMAKVAHRICGKPLAGYVLEAALGTGAGDCVVIVGHREDQVRACLGDKVKYVSQKKQLGTGHAVMQAADIIASKTALSDVMVLYGDTPLITAETLKEAISAHRLSENAVTVITADVPDPSGYGRIIRGSGDRIKRIVEHRDASPEERQIKEINSGMYCYKAGELLKALDRLDNRNEQGEYYLTDTVAIIAEGGKKAGAFKIADNREIAGINDRVQLAGATAIIRERILRGHMLGGVTIADPGAVYIEAEAVIGRDTEILPGSFIEGRTIIGERCLIGPGSRITEAEIGDGCKVACSVITGVKIPPGSDIGPFEYINAYMHKGKGQK